MPGCHDGAMEPMTCSTIHRIRRPFFSSWKPADAGEEWLLCDWAAPEVGDQFRSSPRSRIEIRALVQSGWRRRSDPDSFVVWPNTTDVTAIKLGVLRGSARWTAAGWVASAHPDVRIDAADLGSVTYTNAGTLDGGGGHIVEASLPVEPLGGGPLLLELYAEAFPLGSGTRRPHIAGVAHRWVAVDTDAPETVIAPPDSALDDEQPTIRGQVVDTGAGPRRVRLIVRDRLTGRYWSEPSDGSAPFWSDNPWEHRIVVPTAPDGTWSWTLREELAPGSGSYEIEARGEDDAIDTRWDTGNIDPTPDHATIDVSTADPSISITSPQHRERIGAEATVTGKVSDDRAVERVDVRIDDLFRNQHWDPTTSTWGGSPVTSSADLSLDENGRSGTWSWHFVEPDGGSGLYEIRAIATDAAGRTALAGIHAVGERDEIPPHLWIDWPGDGHTFPGFTEPGVGPAFLGGCYDENSLIDRIEVVIEDLGTQQYWDFATSAWSVTPNPSDVPVLFDDQFEERRFEPDVFGAPGSGDYRATFTPIDRAGNVGAAESVDFHVDHPNP